MKYKVGDIIILNKPYYVSEVDHSFYRLIDFGFERSYEPSIKITEVMTDLYTSMFREDENGII